MIKTTGILVEEYKSYRNPKMKIGRLVKERKLIPIIRGLYETDDSVPGYLLANIIYGPSYLSFEFALSWYDLIPEAVFTITSASFSKKKISDMIHSTDVIHIWMFLNKYFHTEKNTSKKTTTASS